MTDAQELKNIFNDYINADEYADEHCWQALGIKDLNQQYLIEENFSGFMAGQLLHGNFTENVEAFYKKMHHNLGLRSRWEGCETMEEMEEQRALKKCCDNLRTLATKL